MSLLSAGAREPAGGPDRRPSFTRPFCLEGVALSMLHTSSMSRLITRLVHEENGNGLLGYVLVTGFFGVLVFQPELIVAVVYRLGDLMSLFVSQLEAIF